MDAGGEFECDAWASDSAGAADDADDSEARWQNCDAALPPSWRLAQRKQWVSSPSTAAAAAAPATRPTARLARLYYATLCIYKTKLPSPCYPPPPPPRLSAPCVHPACAHAPSHCAAAAHAPSCSAWSEAVCTL